MPPNDDEIAIRIGIREIYEQVMGVVRGVDSIQRQIESLRDTTNGNGQKTTDLEARLRALEVQKVVTPGSMWTAIGVLATVAGVLVTVIALALQGK